MKLTATFEGPEFIGLAFPTAPAATPAVLRSRGASPVPTLRSVAADAAASSRSIKPEWLRRAEQDAEMPKFNGGLWHPYRQLWASERKHLPGRSRGRGDGAIPVRSRRPTRRRGRVRSRTL